MKFQKKWCFIAGGVCLVLVLAGVFCFLYRNRAPLIAFYGISEKESAAIQSVIGDTYPYRTYSTDTSLYFQVKSGRKPDLIITTSGAGAKAAASLVTKPIPLESTLFEGVTSSIRNGIARTKNGTPSYVPLLSSHYEIDINTVLLRQTPVKTITTWEDIEAFATVAKTTSDARILFAGKDGATVLDICGALTEALAGKKAYEQAVALIEATLADNAEQQNAFNADALARQLCSAPDAPLYDAYVLLKKWMQTGLLNPDVFSFDKPTLTAYMQGNLASVVFMSLSEHREIERTIIEPYTSIYFPAEAMATSRSFTAPVIYAVPFTANKQAKAIITRLLTVEAQESLSRASGLAPVLAQCRTPDRQADDARYWVAATNAPLAGLSREVALSDEQLNALGVALGVLVRFGN